MYEVVGNNICLDDGYVMFVVVILWVGFINFWRFFFCFMNEMSNFLSFFDKYV